MGRIQSTKVTANTNVVKLLEAETTNNPCVFNGLIVAPTVLGTGAAESFVIYNDNYGSTSLAPTVNWNATAGTATINGGSVASFLNQGLMVGDLITFGSTDSASNDNTKEILAITATVLTLSVVVGTATGDAITMTKANNSVGHFEFMHLTSAPASPSQGLVITFTNGILCADGLRIESSSWTNVEVYVLHS
tara:strand:- start:644 stop:1219 length:576 start_codon:yes stop_codon:yes gene_type:complete